MGVAARVACCPPTEEGGGGAANTPHSDKITMPVFTVYGEFTIQVQQ